jgi:hypothetical protein
MRPVGSITRGTTNPNRLRRVDRWIAGELGRALRGAADPLVVDLGFGASPVTTVELFRRLHAVRRDVEVVGLEIDPDRVRQAVALVPATPGLSFAHGGFELGPLGGRRPVLVRAFNVLRQYDEAAARTAWDRVAAALAPGGALVEGTCDEPGRVATWVRVAAAGPQSLTFGAHLPSLGTPARFAERLPKALIHRNVAGEPVHELLRAMTAAWDASAPHGVFGPRQRWLATVEKVATEWPVDVAGARRRVGELTVPWESVDPRGHQP